MDINTVEVHLKLHLYMYMYIAVYGAGTGAGYNKHDQTGYHQSVKILFIL